MDQQEFMDSVVRLYEYKYHQSLYEFLLELDQIGTNGKDDKKQMYEIRGKIVPEIKKHAEKAQELKAIIDEEATKREDL
jgi:hypothetical protein